MRRPMPVRDRCDDRLCRVARFWAASSSTTRCCCTSRSPRSTTSSRASATRWLPRRRTAVRAERADDAQAAVVRPRGCVGCRARLVRHGRRGGGSVRVAERVPRPRTQVGAERATDGGDPARPARARPDDRELPATAIVWFLAAYWLYIDGVNTVIKMAVDYGLSLGFAASNLVPRCCSRNSSRFRQPSRSAGSADASVRARHFHRAQRLRRRHRLRVFPRGRARLLRARGHRGLVQGGIQSLSRSYFGRLVPEGKSSSSSASTT